MQVAPSTMKIFVACFVTCALLNQEVVFASSLDASENKENDGQVEDVEYILPTTLEGFSINNHQKYGNTGQQQIDLKTSSAKSSATSFSSSTRETSKNAASSAALLSAMNEKLDIGEEKATLKMEGGALHEVLTVREPLSKEKSVSKSSGTEIKGIEIPKLKTEIGSTESNWHDMKEESEGKGKKQVVSKTYVTEGPVVKTWSWSTKVNESKSSSSEEIRLLKEAKMKAEARIKLEAEARAKAEMEAVEVRRQLQLKLKALRQAQAKIQEEAAARAKAEALVVSESKALVAARAIAEASSAAAAQAKEKAKVEEEARSQLQTKIVSILKTRRTSKTEVVITEEIIEKAKLSAEASTVASEAAKEAARAIRIAAMARANAAVKALAVQRATVVQSIAVSNANAAASTLKLALEQAIISSKSALALQTEAFAIMSQAVKAAVAEGAAVDYAKHKLAILISVSARAKASSEAAASASAATAVAINKLASLQMSNEKIASDAAATQEVTVSRAETALVEVRAAAKEEMTSVAEVDVQGSTIEAAAAAHANPIQGVRNGVVIGLGLSGTLINEQQAEVLRQTVANWKSGEKGGIGGHLFPKYE
ncbi:hypothetical protein WN48_06346 [Eufriesea mexicana]|uniref:Uncharacterized protein n=1 Tax=Eufriesea mexicana TaxID=516756 RepID=A0A310S8Q9_9HYME|nr:PREDICTED: uncharacterized abhydrolase domain-containing protein DDB_G0269086-like [Eufriesea mexicana]OAD54671.1 hypothetical protein WN48_06346 [Eufriesea mexicana]